MAALFGFCITRASKWLLVSIGFGRVVNPNHNLETLTHAQRTELNTGNSRRSSARIAHAGVWHAPRIVQSHQVLSSGTQGLSGAKFGPTSLTRCHADIQCTL